MTAGISRTSTSRITPPPVAGKAGHHDNANWSQPERRGLYRTDAGENAQSNRISDHHFFPPRFDVGCRPKGTQPAHDTNHEVEFFLENSRRCRPQEHVPRDAAAYTSQDGQDKHAEQV